MAKETYTVLIGDREAGIKLLFERYAKKMQNYAKYKWKIGEDASWDMVYATIYRTADVIGEYSFVSEEKFASFVFRIFINKIRDHFRNVKASSAGITEVEMDDNLNQRQEEVMSPPSVSPALLFLQEELDKLEDWQRILLLMRSQEVSYSEISKYVDRPEQQLKVYYGRLKKQLTEKVNQRLNQLTIKNQIHEKY